MASPKVHLGPGGGSRWDAGLGPHCHAALPADLADVRGGRQIWRQGPGEVARAGAWDDDDGMGGTSNVYSLRWKITIYNRYIDQLSIAILNYQRVTNIARLPVKMLVPLLYFNQPSP